MNQNNRAKAVADGCVIWQIEQSVVSRTVRFSYGTDITPSFHPLLPNHMGRKKQMGPSGTLIVVDAWSEIVKKVCLHLRHLAPLAERSVRGPQCGQVK